MLTTSYEVLDGQELFNLKQTKILQLHINLIKYALKWKYSYKHWYKIITCMIFKDRGNIMIYRLRVIHIYEADLGALLAIKWRKLTHQLFAQIFFHHGLYATVPTRTVHNPVLITMLQCEISCLTRTILAKGESDATACYNQILPTVASPVS